MTIQSLEGKIVAITRAESEASEFISIVKDMGGTPIALHTIEVVPIDRSRGNDFVELMQKKRHDYCAFMSVHAVKLLFQIVDPQTAVSLLKHTTVIAIGPKTLEALAPFGLDGVVPRDFSSRGLVDLLSAQSPGGKRIIIPRSGAADEYLSRPLTDLGMEVDEIQLYHVIQSDPSPQWYEFVRLLGARRIDCVIFTSASSVRAFINIVSKLSPMIDGIDKYTRVISIGPVTSKELASHKIESVESLEHTVKGSVEQAASTIRLDSRKGMSY